MPAARSQFSKNFVQRAARFEGTRLLAVFPLDVQITRRIMRQRRVLRDVRRDSLVSLSDPFGRDHAEVPFATRTARRGLSVMSPSTPQFISRRMSSSVLTVHTLILRFNL
jgi:hypothetical protein